jgi:hypothetical protein
MTAEECTPDRPCWSPTCDVCYDDEGDDDGDGDLAVAARTNGHGPNGQGPKRGEKLDLLDLARDNYRFGVTATRETFAVPLVGPPLVLMVRGDRDTLGPALDRAYFAAKGKPANRSALADVLRQVDAWAEDHAPEALHIRAARFGDLAAGTGVLWVDLGGRSGDAIRVAGGAWETCTPPPTVLFRRTALTGLLPAPVRGGDLAELWQWLNVDEADRPLILAWLLVCLVAGVPCPVLVLSGEQGTGKSTALRVLVWLVDPSRVRGHGRMAPTDPAEWLTAADASRVIALDNLSEIKPWQSDAFCRFVTGDGDVRRQKYTDKSLVLFDAQGCLAVNGLALTQLPGDLADRALPVTLHRIAEEDRREEAELLARWEEAHPRILGALLDLLARVLAELPNVKLARLPRMADFARWLASLDRVEGTEGLDRYAEAQSTLAVSSLEGDAFVTACEALGAFDGGASTLLDRVNALCRRPIARTTGRMTPRP